MGAFRIWVHSEFGWIHLKSNAMRMTAIVCWLGAYKCRGICFGAFAPVNIQRLPWFQHFPRKNFILISIMVFHEYKEDFQQRKSLEHSSKFFKTVLWKMYEPYFSRISSEKVWVVFRTFSLMKVFLTFMKNHDRN